MKKIRFRPALILFSALFWLMSFGGIHIDYGTVTLDVGKGTPVSMEKALTEEKTIAGRMIFAVPRSFSGVETPLEKIAGVRYRLNEAPGNRKSAAEQLFVYYFSNEKYLLNLNDKKKTDAIEMAIVKNILPYEQVSGIISGSQFPTGSKKSASGVVYDYYVTKFKDSSGKWHNVEFAFTKDGDRGLGCFLYVFTDSVHKEDILYVMDSVRFAP